MISFTSLNALSIPDPNRSLHGLGFFYTRMILIRIRVIRVHSHYSRSIKKARLDFAGGPLSQVLIHLHLFVFNPVAYHLNYHTQPNEPDDSQHSHPERYVFTFRHGAPNEGWGKEDGHNQGDKELFKACTNWLT